MLNRGRLSKPYSKRALNPLRWVYRLYGTRRGWWRENRVATRSGPFRAQTWVRRLARAARATAEIGCELAEALEKKERNTGSE